MKELTRTYSDLLQDKRVRGEQNKYEAFSRQRSTVLNKYRRIYQAYTDLQAGLSRAKQFYEEMKDTVDSLQKNVQSFVENRRSEGGQLLSAIEAAKGSGADREQARLKDLMERMSVSPSTASSHSPVPDQRGMHRPPPLQQTSYSSNTGGNLYNPTRSPPVTPAYGQQANGHAYQHQPQQSYTPTSSSSFQQNYQQQQHQSSQPYNPSSYPAISPPAHQQYFSPPPQGQSGAPSTTTMYAQQHQHQQHSSLGSMPQGWQVPPPPPGPPPGQAGQGADPWSGLSAWK